MTFVGSGGYKDKRYIAKSEKLLKLERYMN